MEDSANYGGRRVGRALRVGSIPMLPDWPAAPHLDVDKFRSRQSGADYVWMPREQVSPLGFFVLVTGGGLILISYSQK